MLESTHNNGFSNIKKIAYLGGHDQLMVDNIVRSESHAEEGTGGVKMARHTSTTVHILTDTLSVHKDEGKGDC